MSVCFDVQIILTLVLGYHCNVKTLSIDREIFCSPAQNYRKHFEKSTSCFLLQTIPTWLEKTNADRYRKNHCANLALNNQFQCVESTWPVVIAMRKTKRKPQSPNLIRLKKQTCLCHIANYIIVGVISCYHVIMLYVFFSLPGISNYVIMMQNRLLQIVNPINIWESLCSLWMTSLTQVFVTLITKKIWLHEVYCDFYA